MITEEFYNYFSHVLSVVRAHLESILAGNFNKTIKGKKLNQVVRWFGDEEETHNGEILMELRIPYQLKICSSPTHSLSYKRPSMN